MPPSNSDHKTSEAERISAEKITSAADKVAASAEVAAKVVSDAVSAAQIVVANAVSASQVIVANATKSAAEAVQRGDEHTTKTLSDALRDVFGENTASGRFVDVSRIPLICKSIVDMHDSLEKINEKLDTRFITTDAFWPVKTIVYSGAGLILVAVATALLALVVMK